MARRYFNWKLAIVLVVGLTVLCVTAYGLRQWQKGNKAEQGLELGNKAYEEKRYKEAANYLGRYVGVYQDDVPVLLKYADAHLNIRPLKRNNISQAIGSYNAVLIVDPGNTEAVRRLVGLYVQMGTFGEAERLAAEYLSTAQDFEVRRLLASALAGQRKIAESIAEFQSIIAAEPNQILVYDSLGRMAEGFPGEFSSPAADWYDKAVENNPNTALAYIIRAAFDMRNGNMPAAAADLAKAETLELTDTAVRLRLASEFLAAGLPEKAEKHLVAVKEQDPTSQALWQIWAQLAMRSQSQAKMLEVAEDGLKNLSAAPWDFMLMATELFAKGGDLDRADECIKKLDQKDINPMVVASLKALVAGEKGDLREAVEFWRQSVSLGNKNPQARLALASMLVQLGDTQSALRQLRTFVSQWPDSFDGRLAIAKLLAKTGDWQGAAEHARRASQLAPDNDEAAMLSAQARMQLLSPDSANENKLEWQGVVEQLTSLEKTGANALQAKLLRLQAMVLRKQFAEASQLVAELKKEYPSTYRVTMAEVGLLAAEEKDDQAITMLNSIIKEYPQVAEPVKFLALLLDRRKDRDGSEAVVKEALERIEDPLSRSDMVLTLAQLYNQWDRPDDAYRLLEDISREIPDSIPIKRRLLNSSIIVKDPEKAQKLVDEIKVLEGEDGWQWRLEQARLWYNTGDVNEVTPRIISVLQENLLANPDDLAARVLLAQTYERSGRAQMALATYREALSRAPQDVGLIIKTVAALYDAHEYEEARGILNRISKENISDPALKKLQFQTHLQRGELASATDVLQEYLISDPNNTSMTLSLALLKIQQNEFDEARELLDELQAKDPNSLQTIVARIQLNIRENKPDEALGLCNKLIGDSASAPAYVIRARTFISLGKFDEAIRDFDRALSIDSNNVGIWMARSSFYNGIGEKEKAISDIEQAIAMAPDNVEAQRRAVALFLESGKRDKARKAREIVDRALESNPDNSALRLLKAEALVGEATAPAIESAIKILEKLTQEQPRLTDAWRMLGELLLRQGLTARAIDTVLQGLVHNERNRSLLLLKARAEASKSPFLAIATLKELLSVDPNDIGSALRLADAYIATGESGKAVEVLREQLNRCDPSFERTCRLGLAVALYGNGNKAEAQKEFDSLLAAEPNDPAPIISQATVFADDALWSRIEGIAVDWYGKHPEDVKTMLAVAKILASKADDAPKAAENILRILLKDHADNVEVAASLAVLMQTQQRNDEAAEFYRRVIELRPDSVVPMNNLAWILCEHQGKHAEAVELAQRGLKLAPNYIDLIDTRGVAYYRMGKFDNAVQDFSDCLKLYPEETAAVTAVCFHLGRVLAKIGEKDTAIENLNRALRLNDKLGGLSAEDLAEAKHLLGELSKEGG
ncbi:MAG: tetratricopeptide repeat protein [Sedimentisphaerales bacterium]|nr:tetratricopeptide repeat protein [Sedimentisphaerales bacterium]